MGRKSITEEFVPHWKPYRNVAYLGCRRTSAAVQLIYDKLILMSTSLLLNISDIL